MGYLSTCDLCGEPGVKPRRLERSARTHKPPLNMRLRSTGPDSYCRFSQFGSVGADLPGAADNTPICCR
jgi:hypothetical protein